MRQPLLAFFALLFLTTACNVTETKPVAPTMSSDSLFDAVMEGHDIAMPKMNKLERLQRETKEMLDSIAKLPEEQSDTLKDHKQALENTLKALDAGDIAMTKWMRDFKYDSFKNNEQERVKYLQSELEKVNQMKEAILNGIKMADSVLAK